MKLPLRIHRVFFFRNLLPVSAYIAVAAMGGAVVRAADLTWDNSASAGVQSTAGTWNNQSNSNWTANGGTSNVQWNNASLDNAIFTTTGSAYAVTLVTPTVNNISFAGSGAGVVTLSSSTLTFGGTLTVAGGNNVSIGSQLSGAGSIVSSGTLTLTGTTNNFTGGVTLNTGSTLSLSGSSLGSDVLGTGTLTLNGGTISTNLFTSELAMTNAIVFGGNFTFNNTNGSYSGNVDLGSATRTLTSSGASGVGFSGVVTNGGIIVAGTKGISLSNVANTFAGGVTVSAGSVLSYVGTTYSGTAGAVTAGSLGTGTLTLEGNSTFTTSGTAKAGNNVAVSGNFSLNTNNMTFEGAMDLGGANRTITMVGTNGVSFTGKVSNGGIILAGATGSFALTNVNSDFAGGVTVGANNSLSITNTSTGTPGVVTKGPLGTGTLTINGGTITTSFGNTGANVYNNVVIGANFSITPDGGSLFYGGWDLGSAIRTVNLNSSSSSKTLRLSNVISGNGGFTFTNSATGIGSYLSSVTFEGASANTYTGLTTLAGTTAANGSTAVMNLSKTAGVTAIAGDLTVTGGTVNLVNNNQIANTSAVTINGSAAVFALGASHTDTVGTVTLDGGGSITGTGTSALTSTGTFEMKSGSVTAILAGSGIALNKTTSGTVTLSGVNTFTGATTVGGGTLALGSAGSLASTSYSIADGATFNASAKTSYSLASVGTTIGVGATTAGFFNGPTGALTLGNNLTLNFSTSLIADGQTYNLFDFGSQTGNFTSITLTGSIAGTLLLTSTDTWTRTLGGYDITFKESDGTLMFTAIPEPSTYALLFGCAGLSAALIIRRRRQ